MGNLLSMFPKSWRADVVVIRGGGRDAKGNPKPTQEIPRKGVMVAPGSTDDPVDRSDVTASSPSLYDGDTSFRYLSTDRIRVPTGSRMSGEWSLDGDPGEWPYGTVLALVKA